MKHNKYYYELDRNRSYGDPIKIKDMKYTSIKKILKGQIENNVKALWTHDEENNEFTMIYEHYDDDAKIYTPQQLLNKLNEIQV
ncbi:MAG: hypothetical protein Unbinned4585contig1001_10 [Prokaryotic dsDNA virus sp.]|nr:MAG: hypothetical protein Unbinned4585contig1001_10 [Prokaryotic dsDNA virus sp.]|tara:strand:+ start:3054 stop:3305 length:252 start_codon:yes stop_codon:yes gene_type:complete